METLVKNKNEQQNIWFIQLNETEWSPYIDTSLDANFVYNKGKFLNMYIGCSGKWTTL